MFPYVLVFAIIVAMLTPAAADSKAPETPAPQTEQGSCRPDETTGSAPQSCPQGNPRSRSIPQDNPRSMKDLQSEERPQK